VNQEDFERLTNTILGGKMVNGKLVEVPSPRQQKPKKDRKAKVGFMQNIGNNLAIQHYMAPLPAPTPLGVVAPTTALAFPPPVLLPPPVADATNFASVEDPLDQEAEITPPPEPVECAQFPSHEKAVEPQTPPSSYGADNGYQIDSPQDISMHEASSLLEEVVAPPPRRRRVHWHESPTTGGPITSTKIMTPVQSSPFPLIANFRASSPAQEDEAGPRGLSRAAIEKPAVNDQESVGFFPEVQVATNVEPSPCAVENTTANEKQPVVDALLGELTSVDTVQENLNFLAVSQVTEDDREAKAAAKRAKKEAERKAKEEVEARRKKEAEEAVKRRTTRRFPVKPIITPLSPRWDAKVDDILSQQNGAEACGTREGVKITRKDFATAVPQSSADGIGYLNDEIINAYIEKSVDYGNGWTGKRESAARHVAPKVAAFNSFFYTKISGDNGPTSVSRWSKKLHIDGRKLLSVERLFVPINEELHWTLLVVSPKDQTIEYFDSLGGTGARHIKNIKAWLKVELKDAFVESEWRVLNSRSSLQQNGIDCGVFAVTNAKMIVLGVNPLAFNPKDATLQRRRILAELLNGGFHGDFEPNIVFKDKLNDSVSPSEID
jgi:hypothetical protein